MFSLIYKSEAKSVFKEQQIVDMLKKARRNNRNLNISGCLLYHQGQFLQYLEGNQLKVLQLFDKIKLDSRHKNVELLSHGELETRFFNDWDMAYENLYGDNSQMQYLKLGVANFFEKKNRLHINPIKESFWVEVKDFLLKKSV